MVKKIANKLPIKRQIFHVSGLAIKCSATKQTKPVSQTVTVDFSSQLQFNIFPITSMPKVNMTTLNPLAKAGSNTFFKNLPLIGAVLGLKAKKNEGIPTVNELIGLS